MDILGIKTGPDVGRAKKFLIELEDDFAEKKEKLTKEKAKEELLKKFKKKASITDHIRYIAHTLF